MQHRLATGVGEVDVVEFQQPVRVREGDRVRPLPDAGLGGQQFEDARRASAGLPGQLRLDRGSRRRWPGSSSRHGRVDSCLP
ncbi:MULTISPECIES: hypothetical protein [Protofrankia]|uniref:hypothetical protein n=1 Tax=Protofrankia TaxID=2994361 RepID=UPI0002F725AD|nr:MULTISPECIES: hypothetical protein [Protofrankia]